MKTLCCSSFLIAPSRRGSKTSKNIESKMKHFWGGISSTMAGVKEHNRLMKELSRVDNLPIVDNYGLIPRTSEYFVDMSGRSQGQMNVATST